MHMGTVSFAFALWNNDVSTLVCRDPESRIDFHGMGRIAWPEATPVLIAKSCERGGN